MSVEHAAMPQSIIKRDGSIVDFERSKIAAAIEKAGAATGEFGPDEAAILSGQACKVIAHRFDGASPTIEEVQDIVEQTLIAANHFKTARAYIVYREQRQRARRDRDTYIDVTSSVNEYLSREDWRVNANANQGYSLGGLILNVVGQGRRQLLAVARLPARGGRGAPQRRLPHPRPRHARRATAPAGACARLLNEGFNGVPNKVESAPPKHLSTALGQMVNFLGTLQNEWAGAQAFSSFDTYLAPFVRIDGLSYDEVEAGDPGLRVQHERPEPLGHADALLQPHVRLDLPRRPQGPRAPAHRRRRAGLHLRRPAGRDGHDQPRLHRGHDRGRRRGPRVHVPHPHLQHHPRLPLGVRERRPSCSR